MAIDSLAPLHHEQGEFQAALARFDEALALTTPAASPVIGTSSFAADLPDVSQESFVSWSPV
jgi:hypothetical protein